MQIFCDGERCCTIMVRAAASALAPVRARCATFAAMIDSRLFDELRAPHRRGAARLARAGHREEPARAAAAGSSAWTSCCARTSKCRRSCSSARRRSSRSSRRASPSSKRAGRASKPPRRRPSVRWLHDGRTVASRALAGIDAPEVTVEVHLGNGLPASHRRPARHRGEGSARPRARRAQQRALRVSGAAHHRQPRAGRPAQGLGPLRPADRARHPRRHRPARAAGARPATSSPASCRSPASCAPVRGALAMALSRARRRARASSCPRATRRRRRSPRARASCRRARCSRSWRTSPARRRSRSTRARRRRRRAALCRLQRREGPAAGQARARGRRGRRHSLLMVGPPGTGKSMLARALARPAAAADRRRGARGGGDPLGLDQRLRGGALGRAAVPRAAPHRLGGGAGRRRRAAAAGRDLARAPRRAVPRRAAGVRPRRARGAARAAGVRAASRSRAPRARRSSRRASSSSRR